MAYCANRLRWLFVFLIVLGYEASAQKTRIYTDKYTPYREGMELYDKEKFSSAQEKFGEAIKLISDPMDEASINAEFYYALCALRLFHPDAEFLLQRFIDQHPESPQVRTVYMHLGRHFFANKKFKKAIEYFKKVDTDQITEKEKAEYNYKTGYSYFQLKDFKTAAQYFAVIKDVENAYQEPSLYYYSHISYTEKSYQSALEGFEKLKTSETFKTLVPYYIAQIYYLQGRYEDVTRYVPPILDTTKGKQKAELSHLVGDSYYRMQKYDIAVPFLEQYIKEVSPTREENYQMGYAYYRSGFYSKAVPFLNKAVNQKDEMSQIAYYHMGECYLRMNEKTYARNAYEGAANLDFDKKIQEDAMFSYAKLAYELSYNPFHEAITALQDYLVKYPESARKDEAYSFLINVYMTTRSYKAAIEALDKIRNKDFRMQSAYQMVTFNRGVELFQSGKYKEAIASFEKVKVHPIDKRLNAESRYWIAESYYRLEDYDKAIEQYSLFQQEPGAFSSVYYNLANYNVAYAWYEKGMDELEKTHSIGENTALNSSLYAFRKYITDKEEKDKVKLADASLRIGDLYYFKRENENAIEFYNKAFDYNVAARDYALFQSGHCNQLLKKYDPAIDIYKKIIRDFPNSNYVSESIFEIAEIYRETEKSASGIEYYQQFITKYPNNQKVHIAVRQMAHLYFKQKNYAKSEELYRKMLKDYPNREDVQAALDGLKAVLSAQDREEEWVELVKQYDKQGESTKEIENTLWEAVEKAYEENNCDKIIEKVNKYIQQFPNGVFLVQARYYRAECNYSQDRKDLSVEDYEYVYGIPENPYRENTSLRLAIIWFGKKDYSMSNKYFLELEKISEINKQEAQIGLMRGFYLLKEYQPAADYAKKILDVTTIKDELRSESRFIRGMSLLALNDYVNALDELKKVIAITKSGWRWAEARYSIAQIYFLQLDHKKCEKEIMEFVKVKPNFDYWIAKAYILLGDNYLALGDAFQAKATLKSVIDHYVGDDDIVVTAKQKYDAIIAKENEQNDLRKMQNTEGQETGVEGGTEGTGENPGGNN